MNVEGALVHDSTAAARAPAGTTGKVSEAASSKPSSDTEILASTILIGGSSLLNVAIGIVRTKAMAMLLGPAGFGLIGVYTSVADMARSVAEMGINNSGVRQIAAAVGSGDAQRIARTALVLRRTSVLLGVLGAMLLVALARPIALVTFGDELHTGAIALLAVAVLLRLVGDGQGALLQGMRRMGDLARINVLGALIGTLASVSLVYVYGVEGVVPALIALAAATAATSWWYGRKVRVLTPAMSAMEVWSEANGLLRLGLAFMGSGLLMTGASYLVRLMVLQQTGLSSAGFYQAAWTLGGLYVGFVLQAMGADFYPRLVGSIENTAEANRLVNQQARVSLLLAGPGVLATMTFAPLIIWLFYSDAFASSLTVLRWICLGMALRVITWPMGFLVVAKNQQLMFFGAELAWATVNVGLSWILIEAYGLPGAGMAFFGSYVFHGLLVQVLARKLTGFAWHADTFREASLLMAMLGVVFASLLILPDPWGLLIGSVAVLAGSVRALRSLQALVDPLACPPRLRRLLLRVGSARSRTTSAND